MFVFLVPSTQMWIKTKLAINYGICFCKPEGTEKSKQCKKKVKNYVYAYANIV